MARKSGLGKGLDALIPGGDDNPAPEGSAVFIPIAQIIPNPRQPRGEMNSEALAELAASIREHGILQPLMVTYDPDTNQYILIAGERRLRAARMVGLQSVPVLVRQITERERLELALIENIQRADLTPLDLAEAYRQLQDEFGLSHEEISVRVGKSREAVTNTLRLLKLPEAVRQALSVGQISEGHARALLGLNTPQSQISALQTIIHLDLNVRQTENLVRQLKGERLTLPSRKVNPPEITALEERLQHALGERVILRHGKKGGSVVIRYYSDEELNALVERMTRG
ncbi:MAG TPA: ParB/RepB/Spo0J family partition protein [Anaerolineaceae bacterium]|nr:ParB/RepB/Spo0J family partition protein [Anaerolineaceae bacterium]HNS36195.1 ParB/RepB/Spo0J family partition protein [Anaerolineaceae bacterium]HOD04226.1 ParB/RepB/Spo0J family partition protein [Anaerolineaceae bacterium]HQF61622.1 ParB/RepB/Spo0J family partition protein [Anaerolineaceae bacterium]HQH84644.1 ParB/RepB/Spo0J family partition protein [Anaerolineaceae bacterium]